MSRTLWKGSISFSLIHIPVTLETASRSNTLELDMLDRRDFAPIGYQRINKETGKTVEWKDIVKAYKYQDDYVVLTDEDFRLANVEATQTIDIQGFVALGDIPPQYFETPYHLLPDDRGERVYELLRSVLEKSRTAALGLVVIRTRQHVCAIFPQGSGLLLNTLRYADELVAAEAPKRATARGKSRVVSAQETAMAMKLVADMGLKWNPEAFHDSYREDLLKRVEQKVRSGQRKTLTAAADSPRPKESSNVIDLTALLRRSLETRGPKGKGAGKSTMRPKARLARGS